jgi:accessory gene regulator protein AgrB
MLTTVLVAYYFIVLSINNKIIFVKSHITGVLLMLSYERHASKLADCIFVFLNPRKKMQAIIGLFD